MLDGEFRRALAGKEFTVFYQPQIEAASGRVVAVEALVRWRKSDDIRVAVNLSAGQFAQTDLVPRILETLEVHGFNAGQLELEITESTMMTSLDDTIATLNLLGKAGISMAIDDFGTGYSSLYYLKKFPIDSLKIDRSFIAEITADKLDAQIVETIILMARSLGLAVVAEGVETAEQLALLKSFGCTFIQGYYYSRPLSRADLLLFIDRNRHGLPD